MFIIIHIGMYFHAGIRHRFTLIVLSGAIALAFDEVVRTAYDNLRDSQFCNMNTYGELRALVGGVTSILETRDQPCIQGLVRNLDYNSGFYSTTELNRERVISVIDIPPASNPDERANFVALAQLLSASSLDGVFVHLAEGTDDAALEEFYFFAQNDLLDDRLAIVHGVPLGESEFEIMAEAGVALVWSPRSNVELYGTTADIAAALDAGVEVGLAPDWAITGGDNMLDELHFAAAWNQDHLDGRLTDQDLVNMVTSVPAHIAGIDDEVGMIQVGRRADLLIITGDQHNPYQSLVTATPDDVSLVMIDGVPLYGDSQLMNIFWNEDELQSVSLDANSKMLATPAVGFDLVEVSTNLQTALVAQGTSLAPIVDGWTPVANEVELQVIGFTTDGLERNSWSQMNLVTDAWLWAEPTADVALANFGGFRADIPAGAITEMTITNVLPFENTLYMITITGAQLAENLACCGGAVSGITYEVMGDDVVISFEDGREFDLEALYTVVITDHMYGGGKRLFIRITGCDTH